MAESAHQRCSGGRCGMYDDVPRTAGGSDCWEDTPMSIFISFCFCQAPRLAGWPPRPKKGEHMLITGSNYV
ncbi:Os02g0768400 [Oryza sativa Japonica Group]|uniref:Os02g0768400 protein n=1 Tax=Oryza sativa subsp. japonica TaxID=39947 RepID=A0A0P0VQ99_ORYSJ|nr:hypothetical protein EE612_013893 [Oryza sativa]BAS81090.1 Os02g0768400 [Oryza sativa Japonica Group]